MEKEERFQCELDVPFYIAFDLPETSLRKLLDEKKPKQLLQGRVQTGWKRDAIGRLVPKYKVTANRIEFRDGFQLNLTPFMFSQLRREYGLKIEYFNKR